MPDQAHGAAADQGPPLRPDGRETSRLHWIDALRGAALLGMVLFHFTRDLEIFGIVAAGTTVHGGWAVFARIVAGSFLFLAGVSLVLAHPGRIRWRAALRRIAVIGGAAAIVTLATLAADPAHFVYFGILHAIAVFSVVGLLVLPAPAWVPALLGGCIVAVWALFGGQLALAPGLGWTGLSAAPRPALDLIPVFPWLALTLFGIAIARGRDLRRLRGPSPGHRALRAAAWPGRHSLAIYLAHQPVLLGLLWLTLKVLG